MLNEAFIVFLIFILICLVGAGCARIKKEKLEYNGRALVIGVVGEKPKDTFRNVKFEEMKLEALEKKSKEVDGFLIMKDHFQEASTEQYKNVFSSLKKPVFLSVYKINYIQFYYKRDRV